MHTHTEAHTHKHTHIHTHTHAHTYMHTHTHTNRERERERDFWDSPCVKPRVTDTNWPADDSVTAKLRKYVAYDL